MKAMICEMCKGNDLIKQDGLYVCQFCGTKYTVEEARNLFANNSIKIDYSDEISNLYEVARRARDTNNSENAQKYYEQILVKDPSSWEANFYSVYYQSMNCVIADIQISANRIRNLEETVFKMVLDNVKNEAERKKVVKEIADRLVEISTMLFQAAQNHYNEISLDIRNEYTQEYVNNVGATRDILYNGGDCIVAIFGEEYGKDIAVQCWRFGVSQHNSILSNTYYQKANKDIIDLYTNKINNYFYTPNVENKQVVVHGDSNLPVKRKKQGVLRKSMKVWMIICFVLAGIYALASLAEPSIIAATCFFGVLGIMFLLLGLTPKESKFMFGKQKGLKKGAFVAIFVAVAFVFAFFGVMINTIMSSQTNDENVNTDEVISNDDTTKNTVESTKKNEVVENKNEEVKTTLDDVKQWYENRTPTVSKSLIEYSKSIEGLTVLNVNSSKFRFGENFDWYDCHYTLIFTCKVNGVSYQGEARGFMKYQDDTVNWFHFEIFDNDGIQSLVEHYDDSYDKIIEDYYKELEKTYN